MGSGRTSTQALSQAGPSPVSDPRRRNDDLTQHNLDVYVGNDPINFVDLTEMDNRSRLARAVSALGLQELVLPGMVGVLVAGGVLLVFGPGAIIPAFVAGAAAGVAVEQLVRQRRLTDEEFTFVDKVYRGTLPRDRIS